MDSTTPYESTIGGAYGGTPKSLSFKMHAETLCLLVFYESQKTLLFLPIVKQNMAKLRRNHHQSNNSGTIIARGGIFAILIGILYMVFRVLDVEVFEPPNMSSVDPIEANTLMKNLPTINGELVHHSFYSLSYLEKYEQAEWVAYRMTEDVMNGPYVKREDNFRTDPKVSTNSADLPDYKRSGYDRGHLVPAGDMNFHKLAMSETFFMSNMSPQIHNFNGGIWRELEEQTRDWVREFNTMNIVTGPIFAEEPLDYIGSNEVAVPAAYFKVLMTEGNTPRAVGFVMKNEASDKHLSEFMVSVDEIEKRTGLDFFDGMLNEKEEERLESYVDKKAWKVNEKRYNIRKEKWNFN